MNTSEGHIFFLEKSTPFLGQDKEAPRRFSTASEQASTAAKTALNAKSPRKHSTKRQKVFAGSWVNKETDAYIEHRLQEGRKVNQDLSRSAVIREMLEERALDDTVTHQHAIIAPLIRETMQSEFRTFTNRFLGPIARIAWAVSLLIPLQTGFFRLFIPENTLHNIEVRADTDARTNVTRRTSQTDYAMTQIKKEWDGEK